MQAQFDGIPVPCYVWHRTTDAFVLKRIEDGLRRAIARVASRVRLAQLGRAADLNVVAEGVETEDQLELLRTAGCGFVQGYLLGRPALPEQVIEALRVTA